LPSNIGVCTTKTTYRRFRLSNAGLIVAKNPSAFIVLDTAANVRAGALSRALVERYPGTPIVVPPGDEETSANLVILSGVMVALLQIDARLPDGWQSAAKQAAVHWPEAETAFNRHRAHVVVSVMGGDNDRLHAARIITAVAGTITAIQPQSSGVLWDLAVAHSSRLFADLSLWAFSPYPDFPTALWVGIHPFRAQGSQAGVITHGLSKFIGREIELEGPVSPFKSLVGTARGLAAYLLRGDPAIRDGDTFGESEAERIQVHFKVSHRFAGLPIIAAALPGA
jgi:hypothetical protein